MQHRSISSVLSANLDGTAEEGHGQPRRRTMENTTPPSGLQLPHTQGWPSSPQEGQLLAAGGAQYLAPGSGSSAPPKDSVVVHDFHAALGRSPDMAVAVAAIKALTGVIQRSSAQTVMGLDAELQSAAAALQACNPTAISLKAGCELFLRYATRTSALEDQNFASAKARIIQRGNHFAETSTRARATIADMGARFVRSGTTVLCHGHSRVALALLQRAAQQGVRFSVIVTEGRPDDTGLSMARALDELHIPVTLVLDSGAAYCLERVDMVLVGAEGVVENGGVINKLGTYQLALCARAHNIPFYVAAESYKFARLYPLSQRDLPVEPKHVDFGPLMPSNAVIDNPSRDYTPPRLITLLFTDLGVLTPAAVSDELIQLYV